MNLDRLAFVLFRRTKLQTDCKYQISIQAPLKFSNNVCSGENQPIPGRVTERLVESDTKGLLVK